MTVDYNKMVKVYGRCNECGVWHPNREIHAGCLESLGNFANSEYGGLCTSCQRRDDEEQRELRAKYARANAARDSTYREAIECGCPLHIASDLANISQQVAYKKSNRRNDEKWRQE